MVNVNVMLHDLVPEHNLLSEEEAAKVFEEFNIKADQLPKIRKEDPIIKLLEIVEGPIEQGRIIKITRLSVSAGVSTVYRMVVERVK